MIPKKNSVKSSARKRNNPKAKKSVQSNSASRLVVSISGLRGIVGDTLTPDVVVKYANAFAKFTNEGSRSDGKRKIVVGRDGRYHGAMLTEILLGTLAANGCDVVDIGICPTPTVQLAAEHSDAVGGIAVTASHNPMEWNGLKFINEEGVFLDADENKKLWSYVEQQPKYALFQGTGSIQHNDFYLQDHLRRVLAIKAIDVEAIRRRHFKVVVDCVNAAGSIVVPKLLNELGCIVTRMNCDGTGRFPRKPEPIPENLFATMETVKNERADLGIVVDPDVHRLVLITEKGEPFSEEYTVAQAVKFVFEKTDVEKRIAAVNLSTTRAVGRDCPQFGWKGLSLAGRRDKCRQENEVGECGYRRRRQRRGHLARGTYYGRDALVGIGITMQHLLEFGVTFSQLKASLPQFEIVKKRIELGKKSPEKVIEAIKKHYSAHGSHKGAGIQEKIDMNTEDGLKISAPGYWLHLRKSNTEPIIKRNS